MDIKDIFNTLQLVQEIKRTKLILSKKKLKNKHMFRNVMTQ